MFNLHADKDDFELNALADTDRSTGLVILVPYYLTDPSGNKLTDPSGNYLIGMVASTVYPQILNANPDQLLLHAE